MPLGRAGVFALVLASSCGHDARPQRTGSLSNGAVALVGPDRIDAETVARIAAAQRVRPDIARDRAVFDAIYAAFARDQFGPAVEREAQASAEARVLLEDIARSADGEGPPTDAEVGAATERRFWELDRPPMLRTTHAVVLVKKPEEDAPARALAERVAVAVAGARDPASFRAAATAVPAGDLELRVQDLDPVTPDGRALNLQKPPPPGSKPARYDESYVAAAYSIPDIGSKSPVTKTEFGYHVILAVERYPEVRIPLEERRRMLASEILAKRAEKLRDDLLASVRQTVSVDIERSAIELTEKVKAAP